MFDHVTIRVSDRAASERFYNTVLRPIGIERTHSRPRRDRRWLRDNRPPGERPAGLPPRLHGAHVLDPNGNNVEAVFHDR